MKILLITSNATIEKLLVLSAQKKGDDVIIGSFEDLPDEEIKAIFIDKDEFDEEKFSNLKSAYTDVKFILILSRKDEKIDGFDEYLYKPFLPMDVINLLENIKSDEIVIDKMKEDDIDIESFDELKDLDNNEDFEILDNIEEDDFNIEEIDLKEDKEDLIETLPEVKSKEELNEDLKNLDAKEEFLDDDFEIDDEKEETFDNNEDEFEIDEDELEENKNTNENKLDGGIILDENDSIENLEEKEKEDINDDETLKDNINNIDKEESLEVDFEISDEEIKTSDNIDSEIEDEFEIDENELKEEKKEDDIMLDEENLVVNLEEDFLHLT